MSRACWLWACAVMWAGACMRCGAPHAWLTALPGASTQSSPFVRGMCANSSLHPWLLRSGSTTRSGGGAHGSSAAFAALAEASAAAGADKVSVMVLSRGSQRMVGPWCANPTCATVVGTVGWCDTAHGVCSHARITRCPHARMALLRVPAARPHHRAARPYGRPRLPANSWPARWHGHAAARPRTGGCTCRLCATPL